MFLQTWSPRWYLGANEFFRPSSLWHIALHISGWLSLGSALNSWEAQLPLMQLITDSKHAKIFQYYLWTYPLPCSPWKIYLLNLTFGAPSRFQDTQIYLHFLPSLGIQNIYLVEKIIYSLKSMAWLLLGWWRRWPRHPQQCYWPRSG